MPHPFLQAYFDTPPEGSACKAGFVCRGWAFGAKGVPVRGVRLVSGTVVIEGVYGTPRPDVLAAVAEAPGSHVGWEIRVILPPGRHQLVIEFQFQNGNWVTGLKRRVVIPRTWFPKWSPWSDALMMLEFQMPLSAVHAPRVIRPERFPLPNTQLAELPRFAIVTPSYNQGWCLEACMYSVLEQGRGNEGARIREGRAPEGESSKSFSSPSLPPNPNQFPPLKIDYVVQDGGSSDNSPELIRARASHLAAWESAPDDGQAQAIIRGFAKTCGRPTDLMAWINSDDRYTEGALRYVAEYFAHHPDIDVIYGHRILIDRAGHEVARWFLPPHDDDVLRLNDFIPQETLFWRRRIWDKVGGLDPSLHFAMDWDLLLRFLAAGAKIVRLPYFLGCFRVHAQQKTSAQLSTVGQAEIDRLRERTLGRKVPPAELETSPLLHRYLRRSAWIEQLWKWGIRAR